MFLRAIKLKVLKVFFFFYYIVLFPLQIEADQVDLVLLFF